MGKKAVTRHFRNGLVGLYVLGLSTALAGCAVLVPEPAPEVYDLIISDDISSVHGRTSGQILITEPKVLDALNNDRIVVRPSAAQITFFGDVRWADRLPRLVQLYLNRSFSATGGARAVGLPGDGLVIDHQLLFDLHDFQLQWQEGGFVAKVEIAVRILNDRNGRVIASRTFSAITPTSDDPVSSITALNEALDNVAAELIGWVYKRI